MAGMLKRIGRWRSLLGRRGELWYYQSDEKVADRPHPLTVGTSLVSPSLAVIAATISIVSLFYSQRSFRVSQRAYLTITSSFTESGKNATMRIDLKNVGNTPANVRMYGMSGDQTGSRLSVDRADAPVLMTKHMAPGDSEMLAEQTMTGPGDATDKEVSVLFGRIEYEDQFGEQGELTYCYIQGLRDGKPYLCTPFVNMQAQSAITARIGQKRFGKVP